jgi:hypothetical protein
LTFKGKKIIINEDLVLGDQAKLREVVQKIKNPIKEEG